MTSLFSSLKRAASSNNTPSLRLVVGLNRVDEIVHSGWDTTINLPTPAAAEQIQFRCDEIIRLMSKATQIDRSHIEYYSALKRYRLHSLLNRVIEHSYAGFRFTDVEPLDFEDVDGVDPEAREFAKEERRRQMSERLSGKDQTTKDLLLGELGRIVGSSDLQRIEEKLSRDMQRPPRVAVLGQSGVGKTTTVNALFATEWRTSPVEVGTSEAQDKDVMLPSGGSISIVDLPGYGRSVAEDARYQKIYKTIIPFCDLVLLIIQADREDLADDQEMILQIQDWIRAAPAKDSGTGR
jgi:predicted GTPase